MRKSNRLLRLFTAAVTLFTILVSVSLSSYAHPGRTDSKGGHNKTSDGTYHYHLGNDRTTEHSTPPEDNLAPETPTPTVKPTVEPPLFPAAEPEDSVGLINSDGKKITLGMKKVPIDVILRKSGAIVKDDDSGQEDTVKYYYGDGLLITYEDGVCRSIHYSAIDPVNNAVLDNVPLDWTVIGGIGLGESMDKVSEAYGISEEVWDDVSEAITDSETLLISYSKGEEDEWIYNASSEADGLPPEYSYFTTYSGSSSDDGIHTISISLKPIDEFTVFWGSSGEKVHIDPNCRTLRNNVLYGTLDEAIGTGHTEGWCQICSRGWTDGRFRESGNPNIK